MSPQSPSSNTLVDRHGRVHGDVRISVTDRCNLRCTYCMPTEGVEFRPHDEMLSYEEIERFVRVAASLGISKVRLTGGEPLVRKGIVSLVKMLVAVPGVDEVTMTTNGALLEELAQPLKAAGLARLNISLDTLDREKFIRIARRDELDRVLRGIAAAREAGFENIKLNALAIRDMTESDVALLARYAVEHGHELRFIEFMPADGDQRWQREQVLPGEEILKILAREIGPLEPISTNGSHAPATTYRFADGGGRIGVIPSVSQPFCARCDRLRLTADGNLRNCLFSARQWNARSLLRSRATQHDLAELIRAAVRDKHKVRGSDDGELSHCDRPMYQIGG